MPCDKNALFEFLEVYNQIIDSKQPKDIITSVVVLYQSSSKKAHVLRHGMNCVYQKLVVAAP